MEKTKEQLESDYDMKEIIVIDNGTETTKIGFSGEDYPRLVIDSMGSIVTLKDDADLLSNKPQNLFGVPLKQGLQDPKIELKLCNLIERSKIVDLDMTKEMWKYALEDCLQCNELQYCNLCIIDSIGNSKDYKQKLAEVIFEDLKIQSVIFLNSATTSLLYTGETTGLVVESGDGISTVTPIFEGYPIYHAMKLTNLAGQDSTSSLKSELSVLPKFQEFQAKKSEIEVTEIIKDIKEKLCDVTLDYNSIIKGPETLTEEERSYELPDGKVIEINNQIKYKPAELVFNPGLGNINQWSLTDMLKDSLERCDLELKNDILKCVAICGGNSLFPNYPFRIQKEIFKILPKNVQKNDVNFHFDSLRKYASWIGGSMVASLSTFQSLAITKTEYDDNPETKVSIIHKRTI